MKTILTLLTLIIGFSSLAQSTSTRWEKARYEKTVNDQKIYYFEVYAVNHEFSSINFSALVNEFYQKDGIIDLVQYSEKQINVYAYEEIDIDVVKSIFVLFDTDIELSPKKSATIEHINNSSIKK